MTPSNTINHMIEEERRLFSEIEQRRDEKTSIALTAFRAARTEKKSEYAATMEQLATSKAAHVASIQQYVKAVEELLNYIKPDFDYVRRNSPPGTDWQVVRSVDRFIKTIEQRRRSLANE